MATQSGNRRITLADVAARAGVDKSTVSLVLNRKALAARLLPETRRKITDAACELGYRPSITAREFKSGKSGILAMVLGDIENVYFASMAAAFIKHAEAAGCQALISVTGYDPKREIEALRMFYDRNVDGVLYTLHSIEADPALLDTLLATRFPVVLHGSRNPGTFSRLSVDCEEALEEAVGSIARRHRRVGVFVYPGEWPRNYRSFEAACRRHGAIPVPCPIAAIESKPLEEEMVAITREANAPRAWFVSGTAPAMRLASRLYRAKVAIPEEFEMVTFWDTDWCSVHIPALSTIAFDMDLAMAKTVAHLRNFATEGPQHLRLTGRFIPRETTR